MRQKILNIITGWGKRLGFLKVQPGELDMAGKRLEMCKACPFTKQSSALKIVNGQGSMEHFSLCTKCGCPVYEKTIVKQEKCPVGKW